NNDHGYRGPTASKAAGITYRQLDYWARTGLVVPSLRGAEGSGTHRLYSFRDVLVLKVVKRLLDTGVSLQQIRTAVEHLREGGVGVWGIDVGRVWSEVEDTWAELRAERLAEGRTTEDDFPGEELAVLRDVRRKTAS